MDTAQIRAGLLSSTAMPPNPAPSIIADASITADEIYYLVKWELAKDKWDTWFRRMINSSMEP